MLIRISVLMSYLLKNLRHSKLLTSHRNDIKKVIHSFPLKFEREGSFGPLQVVLTLAASHFGLSSGQGQTWGDSLADVAKDFGVALGWEPGASYSKNSFHVARKKMTSEMMTDLWNHTASIVKPTPKTIPLVRIRGLRFLHVDGSQFHTPRSVELMQELGVQTNGKNSDTHYPSGQLVTAIEGGSGMLLGTCLTRCKKKDELSQSHLTMGERSGLEELMYLQGENDCFVADAGFLSYRIMSDMADGKRSYIVAAGNNWNFVKKFKRSRQADGTVIITVPQTHTNKDLRGQTLHVRLITIKGSDGKKKFIVTNIMKGYLSLHEIRQAYKQRWSIEIFFRHVKTYLGMRHMRSRTLAGVKQEIFTIMFMMRMTARIQSTVTCAVNTITNTFDVFKTGFRKTRMSLTFKYTWMLMKYTIRKPSEDELKDLYLQWDGLLRNLQVYVPNRRNKRVSHSPTGVYKEKRPERSERNVNKTLEKS
jgi:hypothetical protein